GVHIADDPVVVYRLISHDMTPWLCDRLTLLLYLYQYHCSVCQSTTVTPFPCISRHVEQSHIPAQARCI
ncbi:MAG: hypothetical protein PUP92_24975, partial [Rhizonema sp. PD38]|nr:hypothetical protein [Rhizonema sp. PD38]